MKRLTLDQTWEQCLAMWKWISRQCLGKNMFWCKRNVSRLKRQWLKANGFEDEAIDHDCFLCEYDEQRRGANDCGCPACPAKKIDDNFECCNEEYEYESRPRKFYAELKRLNKIRLAKK